MIMHKIRQIRFIGILALVFVVIPLALHSIPFVQASAVVGNGSPGSCTEDALRTAVAQGGTITFNCGGSPHIISVNDDIVISKDTVIDGGGTQQGGLITLNGQGKTRVLRTNQELSLTIKNLTIINGKESKKGSGGGVLTGWKNTLVVDNCIFENNDGTAGNQETGAGAIATDSDSTITIRNSLFRNNRGINGGALNNLLSELLVENSVFINNDSSPGGKSAQGAGGAVYIDGASRPNDSKGGTITIRDCVFQGNKAAREGGGLYSWIYPPDKAYVERVVFDQNMVVRDSQGNAYGGGMRHGFGDFYISNVTFSNNVSDAQGGGFWTNVTNREGILTNVTFVGNRATADNPYGDRGLGGAIGGEGKFSCINCTIANNHADSYGGAIYGGSKITLKNTIISNNTSGNQWKINQQCIDYARDEGGNIQYPDKPTNESGDRNCLRDAPIVDPQLGTLGNNGGSTQTVPLLTGSPAIDGGTNNGCPATDQRGAARPFDGNGDGQAVCDSGAYEYGSTAPGGTQPTPEPVGLDRVTIQGQKSGRVGTNYDFTAFIEPSNATKPVTYTWQASGGQKNKTKINNSTQSYTWQVTGTQIISVTVNNVVGNTVADTHTIMIKAVDDVGASEQVTVTEDTDVTLVFTDTTQNPPRKVFNAEVTSKSIPSGVKRLRYTDLEGTPLHQPTGFTLSSQTFLLEALDEQGKPIETVSFVQGESIPVSISFDADEVRQQGLDPDMLGLYIWNEDTQTWDDAATTCSPATTYPRTSDGFIVNVCKTGEFAVGLQAKVFLPFVFRGTSAVGFCCL